MVLILVTPRMHGGSINKLWDIHILIALVDQVEFVPECMQPDLTQKLQ